MRKNERGKGFEAGEEGVQGGRGGWCLALEPSLQYGEKLM